MSGPRFAWEADRQEWERFREMDRRWKATVDELLRDHRQRIEQLVEEVSLLNRVLKEMYEAEDPRGFSPTVAVWAESALDPKPRHGSTCPKAPHDNPNGGYLHSPDDDSPFNDDGVTYCGRCHRFLDPAES